MHRAVGQALRFACAGLYVWSSGAEALDFYHLTPTTPRRQPASGSPASQQGSNEAASAAGGQPPAQPSAKPDRVIEIYPAAITASALNATTTLLALGFEDGSVALYDTTLHVSRWQLEPHVEADSADRALALPHAEPANRAIALLSLDRSARLLSVDRGGCTHVYDISNDLELGCGKLALRKPPLVSARGLRWSLLSSSLPICISMPTTGGAVHMTDFAGARIGRVPAPAGLRFVAAPSGAGAVCRLLNDEQLLLLAARDPPAREPQLADGSAQAPATAPSPTPKAGGDSMPREGKAAAAAPPSKTARLAASPAQQTTTIAHEAHPAPPAVRAALVLVDVLDAIVEFYPPLRSRLGNSVPPEQLAQVRSRLRSAHSPTRSCSPCGCLCLCLSFFLSLPLSVSPLRALSPERSLSSARSRSLSPPLPLISCSLPRAPLSVSQWWCSSSCGSSQPDTRAGSP
jgi:hypothetical protein